MMAYLCLGLFLASCAYLVLACRLSLQFHAQRLAAQVRGWGPLPRFCQVKPIYHFDQHTMGAIGTFLEQPGAPEHELYLCSERPAVEELQERHSEVVWLRVNPDQSRNGKASTLAMAHRYWSGEVFVISDADMRADSHYLKSVLEAFQDPEVGVVTCLYRSDKPRFGAWGHLFESLCIADFAASVLVARRTEGVGFAMGSTMAVRREVLDQIGGFDALEPYLADDFQLGYRARKAGWKVAIAPTVLETRFAGIRLDDALSHQYRWLVTSRVSRPGGHAAFLVTQGLFWALAAFILAPTWGWKLIPAWFLLRFVLGGITSRALKAQKPALWESLFLPWKDLLYLGLWFGSLWGRQVRWGDRQLVVDSEGRIVKSWSEATSEK